ncbi:phage holin family protein [Streptomyces sp. NPDC017868]|uniref:phage holin family protein n=1 Tax=unclassified Streptomyces TaxID=2593676 RepID=UPI003788E765
MNAEGGRRLGILIGVGLACALLPGIAVRGEETVDTALSFLTAAVVMAVLTQVVFVGPSGRVPPPALLLFGLVGFVQHALIWWLISWLGPKVSDLHVDGLTTILLAALVTRATTLLLSQLSPAAETAGD